MCGANGKVAGSGSGKVGELESGKVAEWQSGKVCSGGGRRMAPSGAPPLGLAGEGGFEFVIDDRRPQVSDEVMLTALREFAAVAPARADGRAFRRADFNAWEGKPCGAQAIMHRFG